MLSVILEIYEGKLTVSWFHGYKVCEENAAVELFCLGCDPIFILLQRQMSVMLATPSYSLRLELTCCF